jgi:hypothetical protein
MVFHLAPQNAVSSTPAEPLRLTEWKLAAGQYFLHSKSKIYQKSVEKCSVRCVIDTVKAG